METIFTIARKELLDTLRDRRTLLMMILVPLILFPAIIYLTVFIQQTQAAKAAKKVLKMGLIEAERAPEFIASLEAREDVTLVQGIALADTASLIRQDSLDLVLWLKSPLQQAQDSMTSAAVVLFHESTDDDKLMKRMEKLVEAYEDQLLNQRLQRLSLSTETIDPINLIDRNVATKKEIFGKVVGGFLPYIFIIFSFLGCMYPAIDLFTGEKERGTIETILTVPVHRREILTGKMIVVALSGFISALVGMLGLVLSIQFVDLPEVLQTILGEMVRPSTIGLLLLMLIPLGIFFAGILIPLAISANSFKEAQSTISPLNFAVIVPAAIGLMPGIEFNLGTALIPILNVALAAKEIVAGTADPLLLLVVFASLILLSIIGIILSSRSFAKEKNITS